MYYLDDLNLRSISQRTGLSTATISRYLMKARENGIVNIQVEADDSGFSDLEQEMEEVFGLRECFVTPSAYSTEALYQSFASPVSELIFRHTPDNGLLGISWGDTLGTIARNLPKETQKKIDVIPIIGGLGTVETGVYPNSIAQSFATAMGGQAFLVNIPAVMESGETARRMTADRTFQAIMDKWLSIDTAILGASSLNTSTSMGRSDAFTSEDLEIMKKAGCEAAANFIMLNSQGKIIDHPLKNRIVNLPLEKLRVIKTVILVAGGVSKAKPILSILKSGIVHCLVSDEETVESILKQK